MTPSVGLPGAMPSGSPAPSRRGRITIGRRGPLSARAAASSTTHSSRAAVQIAHHHRERLVAAPLARAQAPHRRRVARIAGQVEAAQPLDRQDLARRQPPLRLRNRPPRAPDRTPGTHSAARGSAGRRGLRTPRGTRAHMVKAAMVVFGRS